MLDRKPLALVGASKHWDEERWRLAVWRCAKLVGHIPVSPCGDLGWYVKTARDSQIEEQYFPLSNDKQMAYLLKRYRMSVQHAGFRVRVREEGTEEWGEWRETKVRRCEPERHGLNRCVVACVEKKFEAPRYPA